MTNDSIDIDDARLVLDSLDLPIDWRIRLAGFEPRLITIGMSGAIVIRLSDGRQTLFLKSDAGPFAEVPAEAERLQWMASQSIPGARVVDRFAQNGVHLLLMTAVDGHDLATSPDLQPSEIAAIAGSALAELHARNPADCPFDHRIDNRLPVARLNLEAGRLDPVWDLETLSPRAAWDKLVATRPTNEDLVITHGDACLPNLLARDGRFTGFVDCARLGLADRWQDLALTLGSLESNYGPGLAEPFLAAYGIDAIDEPRRRWYTLLDEFF